MNKDIEVMRKELDNRIMMFYEQAARLTNVVLLIWGAALTLLVSIPIISADNLYVFMLEPSLFFASVMVIYFSSLKDNENISQIYKMASYITVFCERRRDARADKNKDIIAWETTCLEISLMDSRESGTQKHAFMRGTNGEYVGLAGIALFLTMAFTLFFIGYTVSQGISGWLDIFYLVLFGTINIGYVLFTSLFLLRQISKNANLRTDMQVRKNHLLTFMNYALHTGYYTKDDLISKFGIDFLKDIGMPLK